MELNVNAASKALHLINLLIAYAPNWQLSLD